MNVAIYCRVSTHDKGQNPEVQRHELRRFCVARGWCITHEVVDHGYTGGNADRPGLRQLFDLARRRSVDAVVVVKLDRLFRSLRHLVTTLDEWSALGVAFCAVGDAIDYTTPGGRLFAQILGSLAEFEKELLRERTLLGLEHARLSGKQLGRPKLRDDKAILNLRTQGLSYSAIQHRLGVSRPSIHRAIKSAGTKTSINPASKSQSEQGVKSSELAGTETNDFDPDENTPKRCDTFKRINSRKRSPCR